MKQLGLPLEDLPQPVHLPRARVEQEYRQAEQKLDNLRYLATRSNTPPEHAEATELIDQRRFNLPPNANPKLFEKAS